MPDRIDRRSFLARGALGAAGVAAAGVGTGSLLDACSSGTGTSAPKTTGPRDGITSATPKKGGSLVFGTEDEDQSFDPATGRFDETGVLYARTVFDPLTIVADDGSIQPYLAQSVTPNEDYSVWTIGVRPGVLFHDGTTCDAAAIAGSIEHFLTGELGITLSPSLAKTNAISVTAPDTVTITLNQPWVPFPAYLTGGIGGQGGYIIAPAMIANKNGGMNPIGTGPFVFDNWVPNDHFTAKRNPHYWRPGYPYLDQITYRPIIDADSRASALEAGNIDIMHTDVPEVILQFRDNTAYNYIDDSQHVVGEPDMNFIMCNLSMPPVDNLKVRQAMAMAISSREYSKIVDKSVNAPTNQPFIAGSPYYAPDSGYPAYNPTAAAALVKEVAAETGKPVAFTLISTPDPSSVQAAEYMQSRLQAVGMQVTLSQIQRVGRDQRRPGRPVPDGGVAPVRRRRPRPQLPVVEPDGDLRRTQSQLRPEQGPRDRDPAADRDAGRPIRPSGPRRTSRSPNASTRTFPTSGTTAPPGPSSPPSNVQNFNNPTTPAGGKAYGMIVGTIWTPQIWIDT